MNRFYYAFAIIPALLTAGGCSQLGARDRAMLDETQMMARDAKNMAMQAAQDAANAKESAALSAEAAKEAQRAAERAASSVADRTFQDGGMK